MKKVVQAKQYKPIKGRYYTMLIDYEDTSFIVEFRTDHDYDKRVGLVAVKGVLDAQVRACHLPGSDGYDSVKALRMLKEKKLVGAYPWDLLKDKSCTIPWFVREYTEEDGHGVT